MISTLILPKAMTCEIEMNFKFILTLQYCSEIKYKVIVAANETLELCLFMKLRN